MVDSSPLPPRLQAILADLPLDQLAFAPVPLRARHDGWTPVRQIAFIHRLALAGSVGPAAAAVGMTRRSAYRLRAKPGGEGFAAAWDMAIGWGQERMLDLGIERAICGEEVPVTYAGRRIATRLRFDNGLLIAALNALGFGKGDASPPAEDTGTAFRRAMAVLEAEHAAIENKAVSRAR